MPPEKAVPSLPGSRNDPLISSKRWEGTAESLQSGLCYIHFEKSGKVFLLKSILSGMRRQRQHETDRREAFHTHRCDVSYPQQWFHSAATNTWAQGVNGNCNHWLFLSVPVIQEAKVIVLTLGWLNREKLLTSQKNWSSPDAWAAHFISAYSANVCVYYYLIFSDVGDRGSS